MAPWSLSLSLSVSVSVSVSVSSLSLSRLCLCLWSEGCSTTPHAYDVRSHAAAIGVRAGYQCVMQIYNSHQPPLAETTPREGGREGRMDGGPTPRHGAESRRCLVVEDWTSAG